MNADRDLRFVWTCAAPEYEELSKSFSVSVAACFIIRSTPV